MPGGGGVEDDVVELGQQRLIGQQRGELVERRDLGCAPTRELLLDPVDDLLREQAAHRVENTVSVRLGGLHRVDLDRRQARHRLDGGHDRAHRLAEHLTDIGGRISARQQHPPPSVGQRHRARARQRCLAHPTLACKEHEPGNVFKSFEHQERGPSEVMDTEARSPGAQQPPDGANTPTDAGEQHCCEPATPRESLTEPAEVAAAWLCASPSPHHPVSSSRVGYRPDSNRSPSTTSAGNAPMPLAMSRSQTTRVLTNTAGSELIVTLRTSTPRAVSHSASATNRATSRAAWP